MGEQVTFSCKSYKKVLWFKHKEDLLPANTFTSGDLDDVLLINETKLFNIAKYCCFGYYMRHYIACATLALKG